MQDFQLDEKRKQQLDANIRSMLEGGASEDDVMRYASDFKNQFGKKKAQSDSIPTVEISQDVLKTGFVPQSSVPSSATLSPLEIPRPQGQSERVRIPAPTKKPKTIDEAVQADKFRNESRLAGMYNTALNSVSKAVGGFTNLMNMAQDMVSGVYGVERGIQAATGYNPSQEKQRKTAEAITKFIDKARSSASTKEGEQYRISKFDVTNGIGMEDLKALPEIVAQLGSDIGLAIPTGGASFAAQGYQRGLDEIDALPNADKIGEGTRQFVGLSYGIIDGVLEKFALDKILKNSGATKKIRSQVLKEVTDNLVKSGEKKVTKEAVQKLVTESTNKIANKLKNAGLTALKGAGIEGGTEALQSGLSAGVKYAANKLEGKEIFDEYELQESTKKDLLNSLVLGGVFGGALGGISGAATNLDNYIKNKVGEAQNEADIQTIIDEVALKTQSGEISEAEAQEILPKVEQYKEIAKTIPAEVPAQNKGEVIAAIAERQEMEQTLAEKQKEVESTDPAFRKEKEQELNLLTELIEDKNNEIKELASQPIQPEEQITTEEQFKEPLVETAEQESQVIPLQEQQKSQDITLQKEDWSKDVESTEKALIDKMNVTYKELEELPSDIKEYEYISSEAKVKQTSERIKLIREKVKNGASEFENEEQYNSAKKYLYLVDNGKLKDYLKDYEKKRSDFYEKNISIAEERLLDSFNNFISASKGATPVEISEAYHKAKADGSNPELVKAVEDLLGKPQETINDKENITGVSGEIGEGKEPIQAQPIKETSGEKVSPSGDVQGNAKEKVAAKSIKDKFKDIADINLSDNPEVVKKREVTKYLKNNPEIADVVKNFEKVTEYLKSEKELKVICD